MDYDVGDAVAGVIKVLYKIHSLSYTDSLVPKRDIALIASYLNITLSESDANTVLNHFHPFFSESDFLNVQVLYICHVRDKSYT